MTKTCHTNLLREASKCTIESAAMLWINKTHRNLDFFSYHPFNSGRFFLFAAVLKQKIQAHRPEREGIGRSLQFLEKGDIAAALHECQRNQTAICTKMIHETINPLVNVIKGLTDQLNRSQPHTTAGASSSVVGGAVLASATIGIPLAGAGAATSAELTENENSVAIDPTNPDTWPTNSSWCSNTNIRPSPQTLQHIYDEWHVGWNKNPPLKLLEQKYRHRWRQGKTAMSNQVNRRKLLVTKFMTTNAAVKPLQQELYDYYEDQPDKSKLRCLASINRFLDKVLRKRQPGWAARSEDMKRRKLKQAATKAAASTSSQ